MRTPVKYLCTIISMLYILNFSLVSHAKSCSLDRSYTVDRTSRSFKISKSKDTKNVILEAGVKPENHSREIGLLNKQPKRLKNLLDVDLYKTQEPYFNFEYINSKTDTLLNPNMPFICFDKDIGPHMLN